MSNALESVKEKITRKYFIERNAKAGCVISEKDIFQSGLFLGLNPKEEEFLADAFEELVTEGIIEKRGKGGYSLTQEGVDKIYL